MEIQFVGLQARIGAALVSTFGQIFKYPHDAIAKKFRRKVEQIRCLIINNMKISGGTCTFFKIPSI